MHGHSKRVLQTISKLKKFSNLVTLVWEILLHLKQLNQFTMLELIYLKLVGPGSICTTRMVAELVYQICIMNVKGDEKKIKIISDGGIKFSGDIIKAIAAGADAIMMGSIFAR